MENSRLASFEQLERAPRRVPWTIRCPALFLGFCGLFGWIWLAVSSILTVSMGVDENLTRDVPLMLSKKQVTQGRMLDVERMNMTVNDRSVLKSIFEYTVDGTTYQGHSYGLAGDRFYVDLAINQAMSDDGQVPVLYALDAPHLSIIEGQDASKMPFWLLLMMGMFNVVGIVLVSAQLIMGSKRIGVLKHGAITSGTYLRSERTNMRVNEQPVIRYVFVYEVDGKSYEASAETHTPRQILDEVMEPIFYDTRDPSKAIVFDSMNIRLDHGRLKGSMVGFLFSILLPFIVAVMTSILMFQIFVASS